MTTAKLFRTNPELARALDAQRDRIERNSDLHVTDAEWSELLPIGVAKIIDQLPPGLGPFHIQFGGIRIERAPKKTIKIQRSPDGSSTATITEHVT